MRKRAITIMLLALALAVGGLPAAANAAPAAVVTQAPEDPELFGTCDTQGCGGEVTNHSPWYVRIANNWCWSNRSTWESDHLPCVSSWDNGYAYPADVWLKPNEYSGRYSKYFDTDAFQAPSNCVTTVAKWAGPILLGSWRYDRRGRGSLWVKLTNNQFVDVTAMTC